MARADDEKTKRKTVPERLYAAEEKAIDNVLDGTAAESTDSNIRYAGYASRVRTILSSAHRYVAYTSDIGESFRPVAHPYLIKGAYGVSWLYLLGDVGYEGYKSYLHNNRVLAGDTSSSSAAVIPGSEPAVVEQAKIPAIQDYRSVMVQRAVFQSLASMGLPAFTVHSIVKYSGRFLKNAKNTRIRSYGPIGLGLAAVPALPYIFDEPVEHAVEAVFHRGFEFFGGPGAVASRSEAGGSDLRLQKAKEAAAREKKEL